jgi:hypothetical protein
LRVVIKPLQTVIFGIARALLRVFCRSLKRFLTEYLLLGKWLIATAGITASVRCCKWRLRISGVYVIGLPRIVCASAVSA